ncbi:MAG TPA: PEGA domain-containing protein, partial [bacterium]|nr:PEGA domain-containing protein [bacterium]
MRSLLISLVLLSSFCVFAENPKEKDRLAVMDVQDEAGILDEKAIITVTDYIFTKFQGTGLFWMIPKSDRDTALDKAIEETKISSRKECVDEKCQLSLVAELQANFLINTKIKKLYEGTCQISISKFDVEKNAGVFSWESKFDCSEKAVYLAIDEFRFDGKKSVGSSFQEGKIGEAVEDWEVGTGEETIVKFESVPSEAVVMADGRIICQKTPCSKQLATGKHEIVIQKENYLPKAKVFDIKKGQSIKAELEPDFGWLTVKGQYPVELKLDGEIIGTIPIEKKIINPGAHEIEHTNSCYYQSGEKFTIKRGEAKEITIELNPKESAIKVTARDEKGNDIEADVFVDSKNVGTAPGVFKIPMCSRNLLVKSKGIEFNRKLELQEKKILKIDASLKK